MKTNKPQINEIVNFLDTNDKKQLENLKIEFPKFQHLLEPGIMLGDDDETYSEEEDYRFRLNLAKKGVQASVKRGEKRFIELDKKLKRLNDIQFYSQVITLLSGTAILIMLDKTMGESYNWIKYIAPILVLLSSLLSLIAKNKAKSFLGGDKDLYKLTSEINILLAEEKSLLRDIESSIENFSLEKVKPLIDKTNKVIKDMDIILPIATS